MTEPDTQYVIEIRPATRLAGLFMREKPCLSVTVRIDYPYDFVGYERTKRVDQDEARELAAEIIAKWEAQHSVVTL